MRPYKALSVRQPAAALINGGIKTIENRTWTTGYRGRLYIHAARHRDDMAIAQFNDPATLTYGAVIGHVDLLDVVQSHASPFFTGPYGWVLANPHRINPIPLRGRLGLFDARVVLTPEALEPPCLT